MASEQIDRVKQDILQRLKQAGQNGLNKTALNIKSTIRKLAFEELIKAKEIANIGTLKKQIFVLREFNNPVEIAAEIIERAAFGQAKLFSLTYFKKQCPKGKIATEAKNALDTLVKEHKFLKLKYGRNFLYVSVSGIPLHDIQKEAAPVLKQTITREQLMTAYEKLKTRTGYSNVDMFLIQQEIGGSMDEFKQVIMEECRQGRAVLSTGDWSLASEEVRSGVIIVDGVRYLKVKFI